MDVSQLYMLALRPTGVPIVGESADNLFLGQVELSSWDWTFSKEATDTDAAGTASNSDVRLAETKRQLEAGIKDLDKRFGDRNREIKEALGNFKKNLNTTIATEERSLADRFREFAREQAGAGGSGGSGGGSGASGEGGGSSPSSTTPSGYEFSFSKRVDIATTQLLNHMKAGDRLPMVTLTMHQASTNTPWSLVITVRNLVLTKYQLEVDVDDTMTDMKEKWSARFDSFGYVYQNRPHAGTKSLTAGGATTVAARAVTQATVRTFAMKKLLSF